MGIERTCGRCYYFDKYDEEQDIHPNKGYCWRNGEIPDLKTHNIVYSDDNRAAACDCFIDIDSHKEIVAKQLMRFVMHGQMLDEAAEDSKLSNK